MLKTKSAMTPLSDPVPGEVSALLGPERRAVGAGRPRDVGEDGGCRLEWWLEDPHERGGTDVQLQGEAGVAAEVGIAPLDAVAEHAADIGANRTVDRVGLPHLEGEAVELEPRMLRPTSECATV
jgi:hypothetical protein